jgi:outer membrane scaffolding protein for murein synthesis (MipA/OmpV family)
VYAFFLVLSHAVFSTTFLARDNKEGIDEGRDFSGRLSLGVGAEYEKDRYKGDDDEVTPLPLVFYRDGGVRGWHVNSST